MATVNGITAEKAQEIEDASVVSGHIDSGNGHLILTTGGGTEIDAGVARPDAAIAAAVLVETNNRIADVNAEEAARIADVNAEESARIAAVTAITLPPPGAAANSTNSTFSNTTPSTTSGGATLVSASIVVPPSGRVKVSVSVTIRASAGGGPASGAYVGFQARENNSSGTIVLDTSPERASMNEDANATCSTQIVVFSATPGITLYVQLMHWVESGVTGAMRNRRLIVEGIA